MKPLHMNDIKFTPHRLRYILTPDGSFVATSTIYAFTVNVLDLIPPIVENISAEAPSTIYIRKAFPRCAAILNSF